ncbi:MAG: hypothetical protein HYS38_07410 [Acidobacteria bacterium]|nr:hypothetical protein [Acidobacteriota bacterium]
MAQAMMTMLANYVKKLQQKVLSPIDFFGISGWASYLSYWKKLGGQPEGLPGLYTFLRSDYVGNLPIVKIRSQLSADLVTGTQPIRPGDPMDVELLSVAIPLAHYVLADRTMETRIRRLGINHEWGAKVFSMKTIDDLFAELKRIS